MEFSLATTIEILERTPQTLMQWLHNLSEEWIMHNEGGETWSAFDVIGHLVHGDKTDWMKRVEIIFSGTAEKKFETFNRFAQFEAGKGKTMTILLEEFAQIRKTNINN